MRKSPIDLIGLRTIENAHESKEETENIRKPMDDKVCLN